MDTRMELQRKIDLLCSALKLVTQFGEETSSMQHCDQVYNFRFLHLRYFVICVCMCSLYSVSFLAWLTHQDISMVSMCIQHSC